MIKNNRASVLLFALMTLSAILLLTQQLIKGVYVGSYFKKTMLDREHAKMLALGGLNIAIAQLTYDDGGDKAGGDKDEEEKPGASEDDKAPGKQESKKDKAAKKFLNRVLPHLNRWRDFKLNQKTDGIEGMIRVCISCESGKININQAFDFKKMAFKREYEAWLARLEIPGKMPSGELLKKITEFFQKRKRKLDDVSELLTIPGFGALDIFYSPPQKAAKGKKALPNADLTLQDIFTTWTVGDTIDPLWLSDALCAILDVRRPAADDAQIKKDQFKQFLQAFKLEMARDWDTNWKTLEFLYGQKPKIIPEIKSLFTKEFGPKIFSVLSCGKVGQVEQLMLAVIREEIDNDSDSEKEKEKPQQEQKGASSPEKKKKFKVLRVYWL